MLNIVNNYPKILLVNCILYWGHFQVSVDVGLVN